MRGGARGCARPRGTPRGATSRRRLRSAFAQAPAWRVGRSRRNRGLQDAVHVSPPIWGLWAVGEGAHEVAERRSWRWWPFDRARLCAVLMQRPFLLRAAPRDAGARALAGYGGAGCVVWWVRLAALLAAAARRTWTRAASRAPRTPTRRGRRWRARRCRATPSSRRRRAPDFLRGADTWRWPARRVRRRCVAAIGAVGNRAIWSASLVATLQQRVGKLCARCV